VGARTGQCSGFDARQVAVQIADGDPSAPRRELARSGQPKAARGASDCDRTAADRDQLF
jgi:hypothetical protein